MLIRHGFITNSSSTSFIFFGFLLYPSDIRAARNIEKCLDQTKSCNNSNIGVHRSWESEQLIIYTKKSYQELYECGVDELPLKNIMLLVGNEEVWEKELKYFCQTWNLDYHKPDWKIAIHIDD
jgi:hypothetical protein